MQPPTQELVVRDLHENTWTFRHIYRGEFTFPFLLLCYYLLFLINVEKLRICMVIFYHY